MKKHLPTLLAFLSGFAPKLAAKIAFKMFATPVRVPRPESEMQMFHLSKQYFLKNGIAAFEWGEASSPLVLLIHGWNGRGTQISAFAKSLVEKNFRVVALDGPGHGNSPGQITTPTHYAQFIIDAQKELAPAGAHAVIAHSFGGGCSVLAATRGLNVKGLVLVASPAFYEKVVAFFGKNFGLNKSSQAAFEELITKAANMQPQELNVGKIGATLKIPGLIVHDVDDNAVTFMSAEAIVSAWPEARLIKTEGLGHRRILKDQKVIAEVADFIGKIS